MIMKPIKKFLGKCCLFARNARYPAIDLYLTYVIWCIENAVPVPDQFAFLDALQEHGLKCRSRNKGLWLKGVSLLPQYRIDSLGSAQE